MEELILIYAFIYLEKMLLVSKFTMLDCQKNFLNRFFKKIVGWDELANL